MSYTDIPDETSKGDVAGRPAIVLVVILSKWWLTSEAAQPLLRAFRLPTDAPTVVVEFHAVVCDLDDDAIARLFLEV